MFGGAQNPGEAPKFDKKMLVLPAVLFFSRKIDFKDPAIIQKAQFCFLAVSAVMLLIYYIIYTRIGSNPNKSKKIFIPPKPTPTLPFGLGPAPQPITASNFEETTYQEYETKLIKEAAQQFIMSGCMTFFMATKFGVYISLGIQSITIPLNLLDNDLFQKYILNKSTKADGKPFYGEFDKMPTQAEIDELNKSRGVVDGEPTQAEPEKKEISDKKND